MTEIRNLRDVWDFADPRGSEERFRALLENAEAEYALEIRTQIARAVGLQGDFAAAQRLLDGIEAELTDTTPVARLRWLLERGRVHNSIGEPEAAQSFFADAWEFGRAIPNPGLAVDAAHMLAIVAPPGDRNEWNQAAVDYAQATGDSEALRWLGSLFNNIGWDAHDCGDYEAALAAHQQAEAWQREHGTPVDLRIATWSVATQLRHLGRTAEALAIQEALLEEYLAESPAVRGSSTRKSPRSSTPPATPSAPDPISPGRTSSSAGSAGSNPTDSSGSNGSGASRGASYRRGCRSVSVYQSTAASIASVSAGAPLPASTSKTWSPSRTRRSS